MWRRIVGCVVAGVLIASCGGSGGSERSTDSSGVTEPGSSSAPGMASSAPTAPSAPSAAEPVATPIAIAPCDLVTVDEVEAATSLVVESVSDESPATCEFDFGADAGVSIFVSVEDGSGSFMGPATVFAGYAEKVADGSAERIADLGADAVYASSFRGLAVDAGGGRLFAVGVNGGYGELSDPRDALEAVAAAVMGRL